MINQSIYREYSTRIKFHISKTSVYIYVCSSGSYRFVCCNLKFISFFDLRCWFQNSLAYIWIVWTTCSTGDWRRWEFINTPYGKPLWCDDILNERKSPSNSSRTWQNRHEWNTVHVHRPHNIVNSCSVVSC